MHIGRKVIFWLVCQERQPVPDPEQRRDVNINLALDRKYQPGFRLQKISAWFLVENINLAFWIENINRVKSRSFFMVATMVTTMVATMVAPH